MSLVIDAGEVGLGVHTVFPFGGEDKPSAVPAPVMIALALIAVHLFHLPALACLQIHQPQVGIVLAHGEVAATADTVHQPATVVGGPCQHITLIRCRTV